MEELNPAQEPKESQAASEENPEVEDWFDDVSWLEESSEDIAEVLSSISVHDIRQFQLKLDYDRALSEGEIARHVGVDFWFFLPSSMGINPRAWSKEHFYQSLTIYQRIKTPRRPPWFEEARVLDIPSAERYFSPGLPGRERQQLEDLVIQDVKLFGCFINTLMKEVQLLIRDAVRSEGSIENPGTEIRRRVGMARRRVDHFRQRYVGSLQKFSALASPEVRKVFLLLDEYLSYRLENWLIDFAERLRDEEPGWMHSTREFCLKMIEKECGYRLRYILTPENERLAQKGQGRQERMQYRLGLLKKYVYQVLYLRRREIRREKILFNFMAMFAAALAAAWAAVAAFFYAPELVIRISDVQTDNAMRLAAFFAIGVLAYVAKDRIKDLSREYFFKKFVRHLPDHEFHVSFGSLNALGNPQKTDVGYVSQSMEFYARPSIPEDILYIRDLESHFDLEPERQDESFHFQRNFRFTPLFSGVDPHGTAMVKEVLRFDISDYLSKMSDPNRRFSYWEEEKGIQHVDAPRVYHLNLVLKYTVTRILSNGSSKVRTEYERVRLVLNKQGIVRVDSVLPRGELFLNEVK